ncbi:MAG: FHA domain-containing protein [Magnetococcales bacterium]|nr:FHA domain-containing protein [Magnetococcales bacterium]
MILNRLKGLKGLIEGARGREHDQAALVGDIRLLINSVGRLDHGALKEYALEHTEQKFVQFVGVPVLMGSRLVRGDILTTGQSLDQTRIFKPELHTDGESDARDVEALHRAIFPFVKGRSDRGGGRQVIFTIGRTDDNDMVLPDYTVSKKQATVRVMPDERYLLTNLATTNPSQVNGLPLGSEGVHLAEGDLVQLGRYQFVFLSPSALYAQMMGLNLRVPIEELINRLGRADYEAMKKQAREQAEAIFAQLVRNPALVGSGLLKGHLTTLKGEPQTRTKRFQALDQDQLEATRMKVMERNIYPLVRSGQGSTEGVFFTIGRAMDNDLCMPDKSISNHHARIRKEKAGYYFFKDLDSTNGSFINGFPIGQEEREIVEGDEIMIGRYQFVFLFPSTLYDRLNG